MTYGNKKSHRRCVRFWGGRCDRTRGRHIRVPHREHTILAFDARASPCGGPYVAMRSARLLIRNHKNMKNNVYEIKVISAFITIAVIISSVAIIANITGGILLWLGIAALTLTALFYWRWTNRLTASY